MSWQSFKHVCQREITYFLFIVGGGACLIVLSLLLLTIFPAWESGSRMAALIGTRIIIIGYPVFIFIRVLVTLIKRK